LQLVQNNVFKPVAGNFFEILSVHKKYTIFIIARKLRVNVA